MYRILLFATLITIFITAFRRSAADDVSGTWKRTSMILIDGRGKKTDMMQMMSRSVPCLKDITYLFSSGGEVTSKVPDSCGKMKQTLENSNTSGRWTQSGQKITIIPTKKELPVATYDVHFQGNTMIWTFIFADNPKTPNPTKAQQVMIMYQRM